ncbi:MAG: DUF938 domain-containing protein [Elainellaceae cyanobacterium]
MPRDDDRQFAPATERNRQSILEVLREVLPAEGAVLEVSSGTGEHAVFFAPHLAPRQWIPSDPNPIARASIAAWRSHSPSDNLHLPLALDAREEVWPLESTSTQQQRLPAELKDLDLERYPVRAVVNINMIHISPWAASLGLFAGAGRILPEGGIVYLYGPYKQNGEHTAPSNAAFDQSLRSQNPEWGVRDLSDVVAAAQERHFSLMKTITMPANNLSVIFQRQPSE